MAAVPTDQQFSVDSEPGFAPRSACCSPQPRGIAGRNRVALDFASLVLATLFVLNPLQLMRGCPSFTSVVRGVGGVRLVAPAGLVVRRTSLRSSAHLRDQP